MNTQWQEGIILEGLAIPNQDEAKAMLQQYPGVAGAPEMVQPQSYNMTLAKEKGLCGKSGYNTNYLMMQALYRKGLEDYLLKSSSLREFDMMLSDSEQRVIPKPADHMTFYQKYSTFGLTYIYLRNNLPIERLGKEDLHILMEQARSRDTSVTSELQELVLRTFPDIIQAHEDKPAETPIGFSNDGQKIAPNNALVFEIGHETEWDDQGNFVDRNHELAKDAYLTGVVIPQMQVKLSEELEMKVVIFIKKN